jgi:hypothetical protein
MQRFWQTILFVGIISANLSAQSKLENGLVRVLIEDSVTGHKVAARIRLTFKGHVIKTLPKNVAAVMYGHWDHADGFAFQPDSSFYADGQCELQLPAGEYELYVSRGIEYIDVKEKLVIEARKELVKKINLVRWINMPAKKWYSADGHIHLRRSPADDAKIMTWVQAEDVHAAVLLKMGDFWATYYEQYAFAENGVYQQNDYFLMAGQEDPRTPELGHTIGIGASENVRYRNEYYYYDKVFDKLHELGGITGYAHHAETFHGYRGLMLDGLRKKVDALEILQYCYDEQPLHVNHYYHMLDLGYAITAIAGSDFPWCGHDHDNGPPERNARIGNVRFYTYVPGTFSYPEWKKSLKAGHTFVTNGPMLTFTINGKLPGDTIGIKKGETVRINAEAFGRPDRGIEKLELVVNGKVAKQADNSGSLDKLELSQDIRLDHGCWIAVRATARMGGVAHSTPIYISVDGGGFHNPSTVGLYVPLAEKYLAELKQEIRTVNQNPEFQSWRYRKGLEKRIAETREVLKILLPLAAKDR